MPHDWRPSARSHTSGQSSRNFRRIPHRKTTANTSASNYDKSQPTLTANDQKTTFSDDRQHPVTRRCTSSCNLLCCMRILSVCDPSCCAAAKLLLLPLETGSEIPRTAGVAGATHYLGH